MQSSPYLHDLRYERVSSVDGNAWKPTSKSEGSCHTLDKPSEHGRAADDTTFCVFLFADAFVAVHDASESVVLAT